MPYSHVPHDDILVNDGPSALYNGGATDDVTNEVMVALISVSSLSRPHKDGVASTRISQIASLLLRQA